MTHPLRWWAFFIPFHLSPGPTEDREKKRMRKAAEAKKSFTTQKERKNDSNRYQYMTDECGLFTDCHACAAGILFDPLAGQSSFIGSFSISVYHLFSDGFDDKMTSADCTDYRISYAQ